MSIIATDNNQENKNIIKSSYIICPICKESARFKMNGYTITIFNCKNGHTTNNIPLNEFEKTQLNDESKIIYDK